MTVPVAYPNNQITIIADVPMSDGSSGALPSDTVLSSDNPAVAASWLNMGIRQAWVRRTAAAPQSATITASSASAGVSGSFVVDFLAAPPVVPVGIVFNEVGAVASQG